MLIVLLRLRGVRPSSGGSWPMAAMLFAYAAFSFAYRDLTAATGALLLFGAVQLTMMTWGLWQGERIAGMRLVGLAIAVGGLVLLLPGLAARRRLLRADAGPRRLGPVYSLLGKGAGEPIAATGGNFLRSVPFAALLILTAVGHETVDYAGLAYAVASGAVTSGLGCARGTRPCRRSRQPPPPQSSSACRPLRPSVGNATRGADHRLRLLLGLGGGPGRHRAYDTEEGLKKIMFEVAERLRNIKVSASAAMTRKVRELRAQGVKIVGLSSGEPDFPTPTHAIEAAHKAALAGETKYPPQDGIKPLKEAIQRKFKRDNNLDYALEEIMVSNGSKQIMYDALMASVNPGDEVIIPAPGWISYADQATLAGAKPVSVSCPENNFKLRAVDLDAAITPRTKWVVLNFPNNPTVCSRAEMREIADVLLAHPHVFAMADDVYEHLTYDGFGFCTVAEVEPKLKERTLTVNGASKALRHDRLARRLRRRAAADDRRHDQHAGSDRLGNFDHQPGRGGGGAERAAGSS